MKKINWKIVGGVLAAIFVVMQFFQIDKTNPPVDTTKDFVQVMQPAPEIAKMIKDACYDCHSHETKYPWYTNISPLNHWIKGHIDHGREKLNFSEWTTYEPKKANHKLEECFEEIEHQHMPLKSYTYLHSEAKLSEDQRNQLIIFFRKKYDEK